MFDSRTDEFDGYKFCQNFSTSFTLKRTCHIVVICMGSIYQIKG